MRLVTVGSLLVDEVDGWPTCGALSDVLGHAPGEPCVHVPGEPSQATVPHPEPKTAVVAEFHGAGASDEC